MSSPILSYQKRTSLIHKTPALLKLALLLGIAIALYLTGFGVHCLLMVVALLLVWVSKIQLKDFLHDLRPVVFYSIFIALVEAAGSLR